MRLYVGNIPYSTTEDDLRRLFGSFGPVSDVKIMTDRDTGRPRGFAFVTLDEGGEDAIGSLNQSDFGGRNLVVNVAREKQGGRRSERAYGWRS